MIDDSVRVAGPANGLADRLQSRTAALHREAERTGIVADLLRGRASRDAYAVLLRNLLPVYEELERQLSAASPQVLLARLARPDVYRASALRSDLDALAGSAANRTLPILPAGERYAERIRHAAADDGALLIGHAYTRYLGDLNGGHILGRLVARHLDLAPEALAFYAYPGVRDPAAHAAQYRAAIDALALPAHRCHAVIEEAAVAFRLNIDLAKQVSAWAAMPAARAL